MHENSREVPGGRLAGHFSPSAGPGKRLAGHFSRPAGPGERFAGHFRHLAGPGETSAVHISSFTVHISWSAVQFDGGVVSAPLGSRIAARFTGISLTQERPELRGEEPRPADFES